MASKSHASLEARPGLYNETDNLLISKGDQNTEDADIKIPQLQILADDAQAALKDLMEKGTAFTNARSPVLNYFDGPGGLSEIAARAKRNVKRNYGKDSPEYKALVNKAY